MKTADLLIGLGVLLVVVGVLWRMGWMSWFGKLPGDFRAEGERASVYFPLTSMLIVSVIGSLILNLAGRFFGGE